MRGGHRGTLQGRHGSAMRARRGVAAWKRRGPWRLFQYGVGVGAAHAEGGDTGPARLVPGVPGAGLGEQPYRTGGPVHPVRRLLGVQGPREHPVPQRHDGLDDTGDTGGGLRVADVGLE